MKKIIFTILLFWTTPLYALDLTFTWDANTETDLKDYRFYYANTSNTTGPPYDGVGAVEGDSPIVITLDMDEDPDPAKVQITLHGFADNYTVELRDKFAVTARNILDDESGFSNEVSIGVPTNPGNLEEKKPAP